MFTRVVEMTSKSGKSQELANTINDRAVPILKKQRGFMDEIVLVSSGKSDRVLALSFWNKREDAEEYQREQYQKIPLRPNPRFAPLTYTPQPPTKLPQARPPE